MIIFWICVEFPTILTCYLYRLFTHLTEYIMLWLKRWKDQNDDKDSQEVKKLWKAFCSRIKCQPFSSNKVLPTVVPTSVGTKPILCTKSPKLTLLFYYIKMQTSSSPYHPSLQLTGALKWGTVWTSILTGIETTHGQSWKFVFY